jgi:hypothetical protein
MSIYRIATTPGQTPAHLFLTRTIETLKRHHASGRWDDAAALRLVAGNVRDFARISGVHSAYNDAARLLAWIKRGF